MIGLQRSTSVRVTACPFSSGMYASSNRLVWHVLKLICTYHYHAKSFFSLRACMWHFIPASPVLEKVSSLYCNLCVQRQKTDNYPPAHYSIILLFSASLTVGAADGIANYSQQRCLNHFLDRPSGGHGPGRFPTGSSEQYQCPSSGVCYYLPDKFTVTSADSRATQTFADIPGH